MAITPKLAAEIAAERGLSLADARALAALAEDEAQAVELADRFRHDEDEHEKASKLADRILGGGL